MTYKKYTTAEFAAHIVKTLTDKVIKKDTKPLKIEFATDTEHGTNTPCAWWYVRHITDNGYNTDCLLFDICGGGCAFAVDCHNDYIAEEIEQKLRDNDIYEIYTEKDYYLTVIFNSWTWGKLTKSEKDNFISFINSEHAKNAIKGTIQQRENIVSALYIAFLYGVGYNGFEWRNTEE